MKKDKQKEQTERKQKKIEKGNFTQKRNVFVDQMKKNSYILRVMVKKNFKAQYRGSILGVLWTVLNPLLNMIVLSIIFSRVFNNDGSLGIYPVYLLCGNIIFNMFRQVTTQSLDCLVSNADLIKKVKISYSIFPTSNMFTAFVNFGVAFIALLIVMLIVRQTFYWTILMTITIIPAVLLFSLGVGYILSSLFVFFRDVRHLYDVGITLWMYLTPIFYARDSLGGTLVSQVIGLNPLTVFVTAFRNVIQWGVVPSGMQYLIMYAWAFGMLTLGYFIFKLNRKKYILYL